MASIILSSVGSSIGNALLPGLGGRLLSAVGRRYGRVIDSEIGWSSSTVKDGARLENFKVQDSRYGLAIPQVFGRVRIAGNVIWASNLIETAHETAVSGGKGGVVGDVFTTTRTTYTYSLHCAVAIAAGEIGGIDTIWADSKIIYENGVWKSGVIASASLHKGTATQNVDPLLEGWIGSGLVPAYRGIAYLVIEGLQLSNFGNRLPNLTFEITPPNASGQPLWTGASEPESVSHAATTLKQGGMPPLVVEGSAGRARQMLIGGYQADGFQALFTISAYDVTGEEPVKLYGVQSDPFACESVADHSWAIAADQRTIAMGMQDSATGKPYRVMLYDSAAQQFGPPVSVSMQSAETRQIAWLDAYHFVVTDYRDGRRGVRVFMRSGLSVIDRGFYDVWGAGTSTTRLPLAYAQFRAYGEGLMAYAGDASLKFSALYARLISWKNNALEVGAQQIVSSGINLGTGSGPQVFLLPTSEEEWTILYLTAADWRMMSFVPTASGMTITRAWQVLTSGVVAVNLCSAPLVAGGKIVLTHRSSVEAFYRVSEITLGSSSFSLNRDAAKVEGFSSGASCFGAALIDASRHLLLGNAGATDTLARIGIVKRRHTGDTMDKVLERILERAGYESGDYDVTALSEIGVDGYCLADQATAASAIAPLQMMEPFDLVESNGQLRAVRHGQGDASVIKEGEAGASDVAHPEQPLPPLQQARVQELDLPLELAVDFLDASREYEVGSQRARRSSSCGAQAVETVTLPLVCTPQKAKRIAENQLYRVWIERDRYRLFLSRRWAVLDVGDLVSFGAKILRITQISLQGGIVQVDGVAALDSDFASSAEAEGGVGSAGMNAAIPSILYLMDLPLLRAQDDEAGVYVAVSGLDGWQGSTLWRAADGVSFSRVTSLTNAATAGIVTQLPQTASVFYSDQVSRLRVQLVRGTLSSCSIADLMNGANVALCGGEILQFQNAQVIGNGLYELSGLLRGRQGTESAIATHGIGEDFVLLNENSVSFLPTVMSDRGNSYHFRAVSKGGSLDFAQDKTLAYTMRTLRPLAPCHLTGSRSGGAGSDVVIQWKRRARKNAAWVDYIDVPLDEANERYEVEIMNGSAVVRLFENLVTPSVTYTAAQQTTDWGAVKPATYTVRVYQVSARYGRGEKMEVEV